MPGREDFAIIRARLLSDPRALVASDAYIAAGIALEDTAAAAVVGHVAMLGIWASRETDDGILPGDGISTFRVAVTCSRRVADVSLTCLVNAGLLRAAENGRDGIYLVGFADAYKPLLDRRTRNRTNAAQARKRASVADVSLTCTTRNADVSAHRTVPIGKVRDPGGVGSAIAPTPEPEEAKPRGRRMTRDEKIAKTREEKDERYRRMVEREG